MVKKISITYCTPKFVEYLGFCSYLARIYGPDWAAKIKYAPHLINDLDLREYDRLKELPDDSQYIEIEEYKREYEAL